MYVASTVHKIMGDTVPSLATQIVGGKKFSYWLKEQLYVVVSRVTDLSHITFVGDKQRTLDAINLLCRKDSHLVPLIDNFCRLVAVVIPVFQRSRHFIPFLTCF